MKILLIFLILSSGAYEKKIRLYEKKLKKLHKELVSLQKQKKDVLKKIAVIDRQLDILEEMLDIQKAHEDSLRRSISSLKKDIDSLQTDLTYKEEILKTYLVRLYKYGEPGFLQILMKTKDPYESYRKIRIYTYILEKEKQLHEQVRSDLRELARKRELLKKQLIEVNRVQKEISYRKRQLEEKKRQKRALLRKIKNQQKRKEYEIRRLEREKKKLERILKRLEKKRKKSKKRYVPKSKRFIWPVRGKIVEKFGVIVDPRYGTKINNPGIDIKSSPGAEVIASRDGVVVYAGNFISYRGVVIIEHGSVYTVYARLRKILVKEGQVVSQGEVIGQLSMKNPILHFEIRVNGRAVNPLKYLK